MHTQRNISYLVVHIDDMHMILFVRRIPLVVHPLYDLCYTYTPVLPCAGVGISVYHINHYAKIVQHGKYCGSCSIRQFYY